MLPFKIKDEVILKDWIHVIIIPEAYKDEFRTHIVAELQDKVYYVKNECKDILEWSEKVYEFARCITLHRFKSDHSVFYHKRNPSQAYRTLSIVAEFRIFWILDNHSFRPQGKPPAQRSLR